MSVKAKAVSFSRTVYSMTKNTISGVHVHVSPCYNNTTLGNRLYTQRKGPNVTNPICWTCKNCSYKCAADCEHCVI